MHKALDGRYEKIIGLHTKFLIKAGGQKARRKSEGTQIELRDQMSLVKDGLSVET